MTHVARETESGHSSAMNCESCGSALREHACRCATCGASRDYAGPLNSPPEPESIDVASSAAVLPSPSHASTGGPSSVQHASCPAHPRTVANAAGARTTSRTWHLLARMLASRLQGSWASHLSRCWWRFPLPSSLCSSGVLSSASAARTTRAPRSARRREATMRRSTRASPSSKMVGEHDLSVRLPWSARRSICSGRTTRPRSACLAATEPESEPLDGRVIASSNSRPRVAKSNAKGDLTYPHARAVRVDRRQSNILCTIACRSSPVAFRSYDS